jgi:hypothetical protein
VRYCESCEHCFHMKMGPILMVVKDGHVVVECCKCGSVREEHRDHLARVLGYDKETKTWRVAL